MIIEEADVAKMACPLNNMLPCIGPRCMLWKPYMDGKLGPIGGMRPLYAPVPTTKGSCGLAK